MNDVALFMSTLKEELLYCEQRPQHAVSVINKKEELHYDLCVFGTGL